MKYAVALHKDADSVYGVSVPDVPGCFSAGETVEEALDNVREAIYAHLELLAEHGEPIPDDVEIDMERLIKNKDYAGGIFAVVDVDIDDIKGPAERINLTVQRRALAKIDSAAKALNDSRSGLMTRATLEYIASHQKPAPSLLPTSGRAKPNRGVTRKSPTRAKRKAAAPQQLRK